MTSRDNADLPETSPLKRIACIFGGAIFGIFSLGVAVGFTTAVAKSGHFGWKDAIVYLVAAGMLTLSVWLVRKGFANVALARSPRMREYQIITAITLFLGGIIGALMQVAAAKEGQAGIGALWHSGPLPPAVAAVMLAALPLTGWLSYRWHMAADEHDLAAYNFGALCALYFYFFASIGWWVAWRGGLLPEPSGTAIFWAVMFVWTAGWLWKRFR